MTATAPAALTFDVAAMVAQHGLRTTHALFTALAGTVVAHEDTDTPSPFGPIVGTLTVGEWHDAAKERAVMGEFARDGFTLNVTGANGDFVAAGVWSDDDGESVYSYLAGRPVITVR